MYCGTMGRTNSAAERCRAPKTAKGMAKHKLLKATILSRPRARAISVFAAHSAIRKIRMPALHIDTGVREVSRNTARMVVCMSMLILTLGLFGDVFPGQMIRCPIYTRVGRTVLSDAFDLVLVVAPFIRSHNVLARDSPV